MVHENEHQEDYSGYSMLELYDLADALYEKFHSDISKQDKKKIKQHYNLVAIEANGRNNYPVLKTL